MHLFISSIIFSLWPAESYLLTRVISNSWHTRGKAFYIIFELSVDSSQMKCRVFHMCIKAEKFSGPICTLMLLPVFQDYILDAREQ